MSGYIESRDFNYAPILLGLIEGACAICCTNTVELYNLACHPNYDLYCRDCLTKKWFEASDEVIRCPDCGDDCEFAPLAPIDDLRVDRDVIEVLDEIREEPEIMNSLIGFTDREAAFTLDIAYDMAADQVLHVADLDGLYEAPHNFYYAFLTELTTTKKFMTTPLELEEDLLTLLDDLATTYALGEFGYEDLDSNAKVLHANWAEIVKKWVALLTYRHLKRTGSA